ncbi:hypothetical protein B7R22_09495 [Subtercola boreus]|uniref:Integral membrane protein n=1 Tax=Subtercola boreus TaxID=120213 RepID=A0A3E0VWL2_9MICO|nr:hypothetical protein [Subtercola boreus]RFA14454.1 hypothetical protein B7R22_09495 [Subtercola boreus]
MPTESLPVPVTSPARRPRIAGVGRVLVVIYAILALGAFGRSLVQIIQQFDQAPLAYTLSAVSAFVYIVATVALVARGAVWYRVAWITISFEMVGVLVVGTLSVVAPELFAHASVWSYYGVGYLFIPLVLPVLGMIWLSKNRPVRGEIVADTDGSPAGTASGTPPTTTPDNAQ